MKILLISLFFTAVLLNSCSKNIDSIYEYHLLIDSYWFLSSNITSDMHYDESLQTYSGTITHNIFEEVIISVYDPNTLNIPRHISSIILYGNMESENELKEIKSELNKRFGKSKIIINTNMEIFKWSINEECYAHLVRKFENGKRLVFLYFLNSSKEKLYMKNLK